jgi:hypothetical protein
MSTTYKVRFAGQLSSKRFADAVQLVKDAGGRYDEPAKTWTVITETPATEERSCGDCGGTGHMVLNAVHPDGVECPGDCKQFGAHKHSKGTCPGCKGTGSRTSTRMTREYQKLRTLEQNYDAEVTAVDDGGRAALEEERRTLLARIAEIDKLLA